MKKAILALAVVGMMCAPASAVLLSDNFDGYANQAAFLAAWPQAGTNSGTLSSGPPTPVSFPNSIAFGTGASRNDRAAGEMGNPSPTNSLRFSFDFYDSNAAASPYRQGASIVDGAGSASGQLISLGFNNHMSSLADGGNFYMARILGYTPTFAPPLAGGTNPGTGAGVFFKLNDNPTLTRTTGWHNLAVELSFAAVGQLTYKFFVDNTLAETKANVPITFRSFDAVRLGFNLSSVNTANIDNLRFENFDPTVAVPEAGSFAAVGLVGLLSVSAVWIRKRIARPPVEA